MTVLVLGATSQIGYFLLPRLLAQGESVLALSRRPPAATASSSEGVRWLRGQLPDALPTLPVLSAIVSFGPLAALGEWLASVPPMPGPRVIATSSMSAESKRASRVPAERAVAAQLRDGEQALARACERHGSAWTVLRPTLVYGAGRDKSLTPIARRAMRTRLFPLPAGRGLRQPVHADDLALAVLAALANLDAAGCILPIGGGERLSAGEMFARVRHSLPRSTLPLPLPAGLLRLGKHALPRLRGPLDRLDADLVADNRELQRVLGIQPRPFRPGPDAWGLA